MIIQIIILIIFIAIISYLLYWRFSDPNKKVNDISCKENKNYSSYKKIALKDTESYPIENDITSFDDIINSIQKSFIPRNVKSEEDYENQLIKFLKMRYPNKIFRHGHTSRGIKIDIVMEGTYAIELITLDNEGKLLSLTDKILKSQHDFGKMAVILVDINKIHNSKIREYIDDFEKLGINIILKKA